MKRTKQDDGTTRISHSPGPWNIQWGQEPGKPHLVSAGWARTLADVRGHGDTVQQEAGNAEANARLIAAAPDLLQALCRAWDVLATGQPFASGSALDGEIAAAIAAAKGGA